jgi:lysophospholipase L1-like esterase
MDQQRGRRRGRALVQTFATFAAGCFFSFLVVGAPWRSREGRKVGVVFGDSITQHGFLTDGGPGWVCRLSNHFSRKMDILNRGFSGYTTRDIVAVWPSISLTLPKQLDLVIIFFGANDAILQGAGPQSVPLKDFTLNLQRIISLLPRKAKVILITPPPVSEIDLQERNRARGKPVLLDRTNENTEKYANAVIELGTITRIPVVDFFHLALPNPKAVLSDGLHLNAPGNDLLFKSMLVELERLGLDI